MNTIKKSWLFNDDELRNIKNLNKYWPIIEWIENHIDEFLNETQTVLVKKLYISQPALSRLSKRLGFKSFHEFQIFIAKRRELVQPKNNINLAQNISVHNIKLNVLNQYNNLAKLVFKDLDEVAVESFANQIINCDLLIIFGLGSNYDLAHYIRDQLRKFQIITLCFSSVREFFEIYPIYKNRKVEFLIISRYFKNKEIVKIAKVLSNEKILFSVITKNRNITYQGITHRFFLPDYENDNFFFDITSKIASHMCLDVLLFYIINKIDPQLTNIKNSRKIVKSWNFSD